MTPYYQDDLVTLYCADAAHLLRKIEADVMVTDPPYGVRLGQTGKTYSPRHGLSKAGYANYEDTYENFIGTVVPILEAALGQVKRAAVFTGPHIQEQPKATAIGGVYSPAGAGRHPWGFKTFLPVLFYGTAPNLHRGARPNVIRSTVSGQPNGHPCPKPVEWMRWLIDIASEPHDVILDPFAGSGTTLRAAKDLGRRAIGIEIDPAYCEIAVRELAQDVLDFGAAS